MIPKSLLAPPFIPIASVAISDLRALHNQISLEKVELDRQPVTMLILKNPAEQVRPTEDVMVWCVGLHAAVRSTDEFKRMHLQKSRTLINGETSQPRQAFPASPRQGMDKSVRDARPAEPF
jgi:hypothetical protein